MAQAIRCSGRLFECRCFFDKTLASCLKQTRCTRGTSSSSSQQFLAEDSSRSNLEKNFLVEETGQDVYRGHQHWIPDKISVTFGGHEVCQALAAASRTLEGSHRHKMVNSVHSYFLRPGDLIKPIDYKVERLQDGLSYSRRSVVASQDGRTILSCLVSFQQSVADLFHHQHDIPADAPSPADLLSMEEVEERIFKHASRDVKRNFSNRPFPEDVVEFRDGKYPRDDTTWKAKNDGIHYLWLRIKIPLGTEDPHVHQRAAAFVSDFGVGRTVLRRHYPNLVPKMNWTSLDHSIWYHAPILVDDWVLHVMESPSASCARGLTLGRLYSKDGKLLVSTAQECAFRLPRS